MAKIKDLYILLVEDVQYYAELVKRQIRDVGGVDIEFIHVTSAEKAVEHIKKDPRSFILIVDQRLEGPKTGQDLVLEIANLLDHRRKMFTFAFLTSGVDFYSFEPESAVVIPKDDADKLVHWAQSVVRKAQDELQN